MIPQKTTTFEDFPKDLLQYMGNSFDAQTMGRATRVCKLFFRTFGSHNHWEHFFKRDFEGHVSFIPTGKDWRRLYCTQANLARGLIANEWKVNKIWKSLSSDWKNFCKDSVMMNGRVLVINRRGLLEFPPQQERIDLLKEELNRVGIVVTPTEAPDLDNRISQIILNGDFLYALFDSPKKDTTKIVRWKKSEFPRGCELVDDIFLTNWDRGILSLGVINNTFYISLNGGFNGKHWTLLARKDQKDLGNIFLEFKAKRVQVNDHLGAVLDKDYESFNLKPYHPHVRNGELILWDASILRKGVRLENVSRFVLINKEVICSQGDKLVAIQADGYRRSLANLPSADVKSMVTNKEQDRIYLFFIENLLITYDLLNGKEISRVEVPGLLRDVHFYGCYLFGIHFLNDHLVIIDPQVGIIREFKKYKLLEITHICDGQILARTTDQLIIQICPKLSSKNQKRIAKKS